MINDNTLKQRHGHTEMLTMQDSAFHSALSAFDECDILAFWYPRSLPTAFLRDSASRKQMTNKTDATLITGGKEIGCDMDGKLRSGTRGSAGAMTKLPESFLKTRAFFSKQMLWSRLLHFRSLLGRLNRINTGANFRRVNGRQNPEAVRLQALQNIGERSYGDR
jgi:hypothetical protein